MPYLTSDGAPVSMSIEDILSGLEGDFENRLELFRDRVRRS